MGYVIEIDTLLKLPSSIRSQNLQVGDLLKIIKEGERLYPLHKPIEFCDSNYKYLGKVQINSLTLKKDQTLLEIEILSLFSEEESQVYSQNFIK